MSSTRTVQCPTCDAKVVWSASNPYRPFCSERCKLIDLGQWATESYRVPQSEDPDPGEEKPDTRS
jgi:hypothetical protein